MPSAGPRRPAPSKQRAPSQRERILGGIVAAANRDGYASASVASVIEEAGVSRPTFYQHFANRDECFLVASAEAHKRLLKDVQAAVGDRPPQLAGPATIEALVAFAASQPASARFLMSESLAGGTLTLDARDQSVGAVTSVITRAHEQLASATVLADLPGEILDRRELSSARRTATTR